MRALHHTVGYSDGDIDTKPSANPSLAAIVAERYSRRQTLFGGNLHLIRPLAYLDKTEIKAIGRELDLEPVRSACPLAENTRRRDMHDLAVEIERRVPGARARLFAALGNVRGDYLLRQGGGRRP